MLENEPQMPPDSLHVLHDTYGPDVSKFLISCRSRSDFHVLHSSESAPPSRKRIEYIQRMVLLDATELD